MPDQEPTDDELVKRTKNGDWAAFELLYHRSYALVYRCLKDYLKWPDGERLRTLVDDAFTRAWEKLNMQDKEQRFLNWLLTLAKHLAIDQIRNGNRQQSHEQAIGGDSDPHTPHIDCPDKVIITQESLRETWEALQQLPEVERMCLILFAHDFPLSEIVELVRNMLGVELQEKSVRTYISKARKELRYLMCMQKKRPKNNCSDNGGDM